MSTSPIVSHALNPSTTTEETIQESKQKDEIPIIHHHQHHHHEVAISTASASSSTPEPSVTNMVTVITEESEEITDPLRSDFGHKSFFHLHALNDEPLNTYCTHYGESTEGNKYAKLARLITHFPNFNRKAMERFNLEGLKEMCLELGLGTEGKKSILIDRLFNIYIEKHKKDKLEFTFDTSATKSSPEVSTSETHKEEEEEEEEVNPKTGEPFRKSPRVAKRKQSDKDVSSKKVKADDSITREFFMKHAKDLNFTVDGKDHSASKKSETHNSFGWHYSGRSKVEVGSYTVPVTVTLNVTVNKSGRKESSDEE